MRAKKKNELKEIIDFDSTDTTQWIDPKKKPLSLKGLGFKLPETTPTKVFSIRLPTRLLNQIQAEASTQDIPYQALIKMLLASSMKKRTTLTK